MTTTVAGPGPVVSPAISCSAISRGIPSVVGSRAEHAGQAEKCTQTGRESRAVVDEKIPYAASTSGSPSPRVISPPTEPPDLRLGALAPVPPLVRGVPAARSGRGGWRVLDPAHRRR